jgi:solute carrier family 25 aspartate/glutamate transporter 12/13
VLERLPTLCTMNPGKKISYSEVIAFHNIIREMDAVERVITHAVRKSKDGRIDVSDFLNEAAGSMRYGMFTPMEANIIWHFASRGGVGASQRLALADFQALLDAKVSQTEGFAEWQWQPPQVALTPEGTKGTFLGELAQSTYNFVQGGIAGGLGAFVSKP